MTTVTEVTKTTVKPHQIAFTPELKAAFVDFFNRKKKDGVLFTNPKRSISICLPSDTTHSFQYLKTRFFARLIQNFKRLSKSKVCTKSRFYVLDDGCYCCSVEIDCDYDSYLFSELFHSMIVKIGLKRSERSKSARITYRTNYGLASFVKSDIIS